MYKDLIIENKIKELRDINEEYKDCKFVIFGTALSGYQTYNILNSQNKQIVAFIDNNEQKSGITIMDGIKCEKPEDFISKTQNKYIYIIATGGYLYDMLKKQVIDLLHKYNVKGVVYTKDEYIMLNNYERLKNVCDNYLSDDVSKDVYKTLILARILNNEDYLENVYEPTQYFCLNCFNQASSHDEVFIDCGAYVGDTIERYIFKGYFFKRIYAFEPGNKQFKALQARVKRLKEEWALDDDTIICINKGVGEKNEKKYFQKSNLDLGASYIKNENTGTLDECEICSLDEEIKEKVDFIKADVEGYELSLLKGAQRIIKTYKPKLAICLYHSPKDFFELPEFIKKLVPEYKMLVRHHSTDVNETVLYCYI